MSDEHKLGSDAVRGMRAESLLNDGLLNEIYDEIEQSLLQGWINSDPRDSDGRERLWHAVQANRRHKHHLQTIASNGKLAAAELTELAMQK